MLPIWMLSNLNVFEFTNDQISIGKAVQGSDIVVNLVGRLHSKRGTHGERILMRRMSN